MDDLISRRAAIDALQKALGEYEDELKKRCIESDHVDFEEWMLRKTFVDRMNGIDRQTIFNLPSAQPEHTETHSCDCECTETHDLVSRQTAIDSVCEVCENCEYFKNEKLIQTIKDLPSAQPERLTDDDFETIRIHLNAYKENLGNQHRWEEAEEYQRIIDRFMAFASAQPEIIYCKDCVEAQ